MDGQQEDWKLDMLRRLWRGEESDPEKDDVGQAQKGKTQAGKKDWTSIDLHHINQLSEQLTATENAIDKALSNGYSGIEIIHGKGEGILRSQIVRLLEGHEHILTHKSVKDYDGHSGKLHVKFRT